MPVDAQPVPGFAYGHVEAQGGQALLEDVGIPVHLHDVVLPSVAEATEAHAMFGIIPHAVIERPPGVVRRPVVQGGTSVVDKEHPPTGL